jgi:hypothetical protein
VLTKTLTIIDAIKDDELFKPYFGKKFPAFRKWRVALKAIYGIPIKAECDRQVIRDCTGRDPDKLNPEGYAKTLLLCGRRSGKSRIVALIGAYSAALAGFERKLDAGEQGRVVIVSMTRGQGANVRNYTRACFDSPLMSREIIRERQQDVFQLRNGNRIEILAADYRSVRGYTLLAAIVDECCFLGIEGHSRVRTDSQIIDALEPGLGTTGGKLIALSTPYGKSGWAYENYCKHFGNDRSDDFLIWHASTKYMHESYPQKILDRKKAEDLSTYLQEYEAQFQDSVTNFISLEDVEALVIKGRTENLPRPEHKYVGYVDVSGGRGDASALAIAHKDDHTKKVVIDAIQWYPAPHRPAEVIGLMANKLKSFGLNQVWGDAYAGSFCSEACRACGINYKQTEVNKSVLYLEILPLFSNRMVELLDCERMVKQFAGLERRKSSGGNDKVDHQLRQHDDLSNAVAGAIYYCSQKQFVFGAIDVGTPLLTPWR